ncbi:hypothetical protein [Fictibacillus phosphorivorans]|uniref:hypothetical protein n=1 Tax=Fictibacillus phosphorivorans TaxID=1221500 RepID=UPI001642F9E1|nr:hypothetical protein [Fictibacillus phosphorivorans]
MKRKDKKKKEIMIDFLFKIVQFAVLPRLTTNVITFNTIVISKSTAEANAVVYIVSMSALQSSIVTL